MKLILDGAQGGKVMVHQPDDRLMRAFQFGGFPGLPGDAVTTDLSGEKQIAVATSMPKERAIDNMVRSGQESGFAQHFINAMLTGGETEASAMDLIREKTVASNALTRLKYGISGDQAAISPEIYISMDRFFRDAWRREGDGIVIDLAAAKIVLAKHVIALKRQALSEFEVMQDMALMTGEPEEAASALVSLDLRTLGEQVMAAKDVLQLKALLP